MNFKLFVVVVITYLMLIPMGLGKNITKENVEKQDRGIFNIINKFWGVGLDFARSLGHISEIFGEDLSNEYKGYQQKQNITGKNTLNTFKHMITNLNFAPLIIIVFCTIPILLAFFLVFIPIMFKAPFSTIMGAFAGAIFLLFLVFWFVLG